TLAIARGLAADALDVQVVSLSRNFGKEAALMAGLDHARRGAVLFMDGDGQHPPSLVEKLVSHWIDDGYDVVYTAKAHRDNESFLRRKAVHSFYALINWGARQKIPEDAGDFRLLSRRAGPALRGPDARQAAPRLSLADDRPDDDRRRAAHHDRYRPRIYRQDPVRAEGASDLLRRRALRKACRWRDDRQRRTDRRRMNDAAP